MAPLNKISELMSSCRYSKKFWEYNSPNFNGFPIFSTTENKIKDPNSQN